jgi:hypothetical protein
MSKSYRDGIGSPVSAIGSAGISSSTGSAGGLSGTATGSNGLRSMVGINDDRSKKNGTRVLLKEKYNHEARAAAGKTCKPVFV